MFSDLSKIIRDNGACVDKTYRGKDQARLGKFIFDSYQAIARNMGDIEWLHAIFSAPKFIYLCEIGYNGTLKLGELFYDRNPGSNWYVPTDEIPLEIINQFPKGRSPSIVYGMQRI